MHDDPELADLHAALFELLVSGVPADEIGARLAPLAADPDTAAWLAAFEPAMLETARGLLRRWARREA